MKFIHTYEFHEMRDQFEKDLQDMPFYVGGKVVRESIDLAENSVFYTDGNVNNLFQAYMHGYSFGKSLYTG